MSDNNNKLVLKLIREAFEYSQSVDEDGYEEFLSQGDITDDDMTIFFATVERLLEKE